MSFAIVNAHTHHAIMVYKYCCFIFTTIRYVNTYVKQS